MKRFGFYLATLLAVAMLTGCGSSSSDSETYDSGEASATDTISANSAEALVLIAYDEESGNEVARATIPAEVAANTAVTGTFGLSAESIEQSDDVEIGAGEKGVQTAASLILKGENGEDIEGPITVPVTLSAPNLKAVSDAQLVDAYVIVEDPSSAAKRGAILQLTIGADGKISFELTYVPGRVWKVIFVFESPTGGSGGS